MGNSSSRDERKATQAERNAEALRWRRAGISYAEIAVKIGTSKKTAILRVRAGIASIPLEDALAVRKLETERLDAMHLGLWAKAVRGDVQAVDAELRIQIRRAKLWGLDAPTKVESLGPQPGAPMPEIKIVLLREDKPT